MTENVAGEKVERLGYRFPELGRAFGVCSKTIKRWTEDTTTGFPKPVVIGGVNFIMTDELNEYVERKKKLR